MVTNSNSIFWLSGLVFFAIVLQAKCKGQYQQWHYVLQHLHNKSWRLIVIGRWCLCWLAYTVVAGNLCWKSVGVNLPNKVFFHHLCCWITVANIFKISGCSWLISVDLLDIYSPQIVGLYIHQNNLPSIVTCIPLIDAGVWCHPIFGWSSRRWWSFSDCNR